MLAPDEESRWPLEALATALARPVRSAVFAPAPDASIGGVRPARPEVELVEGAAWCRLSGDAPFEQLTALHAHFR